jgi:para-aminobenzoate synthetase/4-amino-4-deoxychorismate lyase
MLPHAPFVLLDDARPGGAPARLYADPVRIVTAHAVANVAPALETLRAARGEGLHAAGYLHYEAGAAFHPRAPVPADPRRPLLWFGLFEGFREVEADAVPALLPDPAGAWIGAVRPEIDEAGYGVRIARILDLIAAGDIYQANLTFRTEVRHAGDPAALYARIRARAGGGYGALVATGDDWILSFSPEMFFALSGGTLTARPMKGTAIRGATPEADAANAALLRSDPKQRAENLMIVDLMRNDLSRVAVAGSVKVPSLFAVETYPTVHQLVSTVTATLAPGHDAIDAISTLFPCGSITGAPKLRAMQAIGEVEGNARDLYTGSIGRLDANGDAMFNVAIRTLAVAGGDGHARLGLGSAVVADSNATEEWEECLAKGAFVAVEQRPFDLIETMAFDPEDGIPLLERHLDRMKASADLFGFAFDRHGTRNELQAATFRLRAPARIRLLLAPSGTIAIGAAPLPAAVETPVRVALAPLPVSPGDFRLRHKTSDRGFYDAARGASGAFEVLFTDPDGFLTEGSFTSLFIERGGMLVTPPLSRGLLPGVLRAELIDSGRAVEGDLTPADLADGFFVGNSLRGLIAAVAVAEPIAAAV